jgi:MFS family permease
MNFLNTGSIKRKKFLDCNFEVPCQIFAASITFLGMMVGGVVWGNLSDRMGRRRTLLSALGVNTVFSVIAAFMPTYGTFMTARLCSAVG